MSESRPSDIRTHNNLETNQLAKITNEFQEIKAGRRLSLEFPVFSSIFRCNFVSIVVLDSPRVAGEVSAECCSCAALIVPRRREKEWVYTSEGGQWQLLASAGVTRFILLFPKRDPLQHVGFASRLGKSAAQASEDEELRTILHSLVLALCPKVLFDRGIPDIPFINYTDNVARRVEIEVAYSPLTGLMMVEDVKLKPECEEQDDSSPVSRVSEQSPSIEQESSELQTPSTKGCNTWRRRLVFQRMPNLIQTEVPLIRSQDVEQYKMDRKNYRFNSRRKRDFREAEAGVKRVVDHSRLVHTYLPPIVAGFVLITPCLDAFFRSQHEAKVVCIGVGGGALPTFLHNQFGFHIKVIDLDEVVLELARRHFGLKEGPNFEVITGDGLDAMALIADKAISAGLVRPGLRTKWESSGFSDHKAYADLQPCDSTTKVAYEQEQNLSTRRKVLWTARDGKSVCEMVTDFDRRSESKVSDDVAWDATAVNDTTTSRCSRLERRESKSTHSRRGKMDPRVEMIIVDVDVNDARLESSAPPVAFLKHKFLLSAQVALKEGGMLVMNVMCSSKKAYDDVVQALAVIFEEVYDIPVENQVHHRVVFALPNPSLSPSLAGPTVELVQRHVDGQLLQRIRRTGKC